MEYINQRLTPSEWDGHIPGRCTMTGCYEYAEGLCSEHQLLLENVVEDIVDMDLTDTKIIRILEQLRDRKGRKRSIFYYHKDEDHDIFSATSSYDMILYLVKKGDIDLTKFTDRTHLDMVFKKGLVYCIPSGTLDHIVITYLQRQVKELYDTGIVSHLY